MRDRKLFEDIGGDVVDAPLDQLLSGLFIVYRPAVYLDAGVVQRLDALGVQLGVADIQIQVIFLQLGNGILAPFAQQVLAGLLGQQIAQRYHVFEGEGNEDGADKIIFVLDDVNDLHNVCRLKGVFELKNGDFAVLFADLDILLQGGHAQVCAALLAVDIRENQIAQGVKGCLLNDHIVDGNAAFFFYRKGYSTL